MRNIGCFTLLLFLLSASLASADNKKLPVDNYKKWSQLPSKELLEKGHYYYDKANLPDSSMLCYSIVANRYYETKKNDTTQLKLCASAMNQIGILYTHYYFDYQKAHSYLLMAQEIAEKHQFKRTLVNVYCNLGNLYIVTSSMADGDIDERNLDIHRKAFLGAVEGKYWYSVISTTFNYATLGDDEKRAKTIVNDLNAYFKLDIPDSIPGKIFLREFCLGIVAASKKEYDKALHYYDLAYEHVKDRNVVTEEIYRNSILDTKCRLLINLKRNEEARSLLEDLMRDAIEQNNHFHMFICYLAMSGYYKEVARDTVRATEYELLYLREKDLVMNQNKLQEAGKTEFLFQINKMNEEMKELSYERRIQRIIIIGIAILTLLIIYIAVMLYRRWRKTQATNRQLYQRTQDLLAAEEERRQQLLDYETRLKQLTEKPAAPSKYRTHQVSEEENSELLHRILCVMETSEEIYSNDFSLAKLTELVDGRTPNYVSQAINQQYHRSFNDMVNEFRIREACRRMNDPEKYGHLSNDFLAKGLGFDSYSNFVRNFKKFTGLTPSAYQKQVKENALPSSQSTQRG